MQRALSCRLLLHLTDPHRESLRCQGNCGERSNPRFPHRVGGGYFRVANGGPQGDRHDGADRGHQDQEECHHGRGVPPGGGQGRAAPRELGVLCLIRDCGTQLREENICHRVSTLPLHRELFHGRRYVSHVAEVAVPPAGGGGTPLGSGITTF